MSSIGTLIVAGGVLYTGYTVVKVSAIYAGLKIYQNRRRRARTAVWLRAQPNLVPSEPVSPDPPDLIGFKN